MLVPTIPGWKAETIGDDICWMKFGDDGQLYAINPEAGFFGVAPGTGFDTNPNAMRTMWGNTIFTNTALTVDGDVWWEGMTDEKPATATDWRNTPWSPESTSPAAHPNARFTAPAAQFDRTRMADPRGVPIGDFVCGHETTVHSSPRHSVGTTEYSLGRSCLRTTAAADGAVGKLSSIDGDVAICGYNMADYFAHWLDVGTKTSHDKLPQIFFVNWFRAHDGRIVAGIW